jgi:hypothetical protein
MVICPRVHAPCRLRARCATQAPEARPKALSLHPSNCMLLTHAPHHACPAPGPSPQSDVVVPPVHCRLCPSVGHQVQPAPAWQSLELRVQRHRVDTNAPPPPHAWPPQANGRWHRLSLFAVGAVIGGCHAVPRFHQASTHHLCPCTTLQATATRHGGDSHGVPGRVGPGASGACTRGCWLARARAVGPITTEGTHEGYQGSAWGKRARR